MRNLSTHYYFNPGGQVGNFGHLKFPQKRGNPKGEARWVKRIKKGGLGESLKRSKAILRSLKGGI